MNDSLEDSIETQRLPKGNRPFSPWVTAVCLLMCCAGMGFVMWSVTLSDDLALSGYTNRDLHRLADRLMGFESQLTRLTQIETVLFRMFGQEGGTQDQIRVWFQEDLIVSSDSLSLLYLGVLQGESQRLNDLMGHLEEWKDETPGGKIFREILTSVYLNEPNVVPDYHMLQAQLAEEVPASWFFFRLAQRLADLEKDTDLGKSLDRQWANIMDRYVWRWRVLVILEMAMLMVGVIALGRLILASVRSDKLSKPIPLGDRGGTWSFGDGIAVLSRGGALAILIIFGMVFFPDGEVLLEVYGTFFFYLPFIGLAYLLLWKPHGLTMKQVFGLPQFKANISSSFCLTAGVIALGFLGDWLIIMAGEGIDQSVHWTEWFVPQLVWGTPLELWKTGAEFVLLAPLCEELIFRGMLFRTFRGKFNPFFSITGSAFLFALAHGYGLLAFLAVFWSGCLWAWSYERTGSLIPGMLAHAVNNGLVVCSILAFFR